MSHRGGHAKPLSLSALAADDSSIASTDVSFTGPSPTQSAGLLSVRSSTGSQRQRTSPRTAAGPTPSTRPPPAPTNRTPSPVTSNSQASPTVRFAQQSHRASRSNRTASSSNGPSPRSDFGEAVGSDFAPSPSVASQHVAADRIVELLRQKDQHIDAFRQEASAFAEALDLEKADKAAAVNQLHHAVRRNEALAAQVDALQAELRATRDASNHATSDSRSAHTELNSLRQSLDHANRQVEAHRTESIRLTIELNTERQKREASDRLVADRDNELMRIAGKLKLLQDEVATSRAHDAQATVELKNHVAALREQTDATKYRLETALAREAESVAALERIEIERDTLRNDLGTTAEKCHQLQLQLRETQKQLDDANFNARDAADRAESLGETVKVQLRDLEEHKEIASSYQSEVYELRRQIAALRSELSMQRDDNTQLAQELDEVTCDAANLRKELSSADVGTSELRGIVHKLTNELEAARHAHKSEERLAADFRAKCSALESKKRELDERLAEAMDEKAELTEKHREWDRRLRRVTSESDALKAKLREDALAASETLRQQEELFTRKENEWLAEENRLSAECDELAQALRAANAELVQLRAAGDELRAALSVAESRGQAEETTARHFQSEVSRLKTLAADADEAASQLRATRSQNSVLNAELEALKRLHSSTQQQYKELIEANKSAREESRSKIESLERQCSALKAKLETRDNEHSRSIAADAALAQANQQCRRLSEQLEHCQKDLLAAREALDVERSTTSSLRRVIVERTGDAQQTKAAVEQLSETLDSTESALAAARRDAFAKTAAIAVLAGAVASDAMALIDVVAAKGESMLEPIMASFDAFVTDMVTTIECHSRDISSETLETAAVHFEASDPPPRGDEADEESCWAAANALLGQVSSNDLRDVAAVSNAVLGYDVTTVARQRHANPSSCPTHARPAAAASSATVASKLLVDERRKSLESRRGMLRTLIGLLQRHSHVVARFAASRPLAELGIVCGGRPASDVAAETHLRLASNDDTRRVLKAHLQDQTQRQLLTRQVADQVHALAAHATSQAAQQAAKTGADTRRRASGTPSSRRQQSPSSSHVPFGSTAPRFVSDASLMDASRLTATHQPHQRSRSSSTPRTRDAAGAGVASSSISGYDSNGLFGDVAPLVSKMVEQHLDAFVFTPIRPTG